MLQCIVTLMFAGAWHHLSIKTFSYRFTARSLKSTLIKCSSRKSSFLSSHEHFDFMKKLPHLALLLALASAGLSTARAGTIYNRGVYTVDTTTTGAWVAGTGVGFNGNDVSFGFPNNGNTSGAIGSASGTLNAQFQASPGMIFDRLELFRPIGDGISGYWWGGYAVSEHYWTINGSTSTSVEGPTSGSSDWGIYREWEMTGPNTGRNYALATRNAFTSDGGLTTSIFYNIGASSFSIDLSGSVYTSGDMGITPPGVTFVVYLIDAPPPGNSVPDAASTIALLGASFLGLAALRRRIVA